MRILMVASPIVSLRQPFKGGTEAFFANLANALCKKGHTVDVLCKDADEENEFNILQLDESPLRKKDNITTEEEGQKLYQAAQFALIDNSYYDVVHYHSYYHAIYDVALLHNIKSMITLHAPVSPKLGLIHKLHKARSDHRYIAVSNRLCKEWESQLGSAIKVISNGVTMPKRECVLEENKAHDLFWMGRINAEKDLVSAIQIAQKLQRNLSIAGPIEDEEYFKAKVEPLLTDSICYLGHLKHDELFAELAKSRLFLATSKWHEPFGLTTIEALAHGIPVVGFKTAIPEELRFSNVCTALNNVDEAVSAIKKLGKITPQACQSFAKNFDFNVTVSNYEAEYAALI
ncbi:glycosyltransferase [Pseudoalteromonas agarivorans]|uniref:glycosyltransferase n=1 Tax=Pseudoalteromonas agarivorans TaxID=176102 RepID=UPI00249C6F8B|nr:glycosyltransferase [Pseudoalteromonas agarivorans]MCP4056885.1 glycosyltransferase family 4 protein [Pseudoalteromonas sp.]MDI3246253.1 glycosyltransferase [Pseudoalteromonas agarivorans]